MNKARQFEDFILDDYDYALLEDWDLEYLWEWVEFDDFEDLEQEFYNSHSFDPDGDIEYDNEDDEYEDDEEDEYNFDFDFDDTHNDIDDDESDDKENDFYEHSNPDENYHHDDADLDKDLDEDEDEDLDGDDFLRSIGLLDEEESSDENEDEYGVEDDDDEEQLLGGPRYIETSIGTIDLELDDILGALQKVEFDEFIEILQKNNHVYDKILIQQEWSDEEMEFLQSIESLVRDTQKLDDIGKAEKKKQKKQKKDPSAEPIEHKLINTQHYATVKEMFEALVDKATILARKNQRKIIYTPKNIVKMWHIDTETNRSKRINLIFGGTVEKAKKDFSKPQKNITRNDLSTIIYGKNDVRYLELKEILTNEIQNMANTLDAAALDFICADGKRFSLQFIGFLVQKYGTKIYYLYQSQMKNDMSADRLSEDLSLIIEFYLSPINHEIFLTHFFEAVIEALEKQGIEF
jgi:hypothetical protein